MINLYLGLAIYNQYLNMTKLKELDGLKEEVLDSVQTMEQEIVDKISVEVAANLEENNYSNESFEGNDFYKED
jgi:hypothetical protein